MPAAAAQTPGTPRKHSTQIGEWFWRFLAVVMLVMVGWVVWIALQISPPDLILPAAFEAAAQGRATRNSAGVIGGAAPIPAPDAPVVASPPPPPTVPAEPPVNVEKLKIAESIETPIFERPRRAPKTATGEGQ